MRFLFEESGQYKRDEARLTYLNSTDEDKINIVKEALKNTPLDIDQWASYIIEDEDVYFEDNPIYQVALKIPKEIGELTESTIIALADSNNPYSDTIVNSNWISSADLYSDEDANTSFKIKALTLADKNNIDLKQFRSDQRHWLSINKFKEVASKSLEGFAKGAGKQSIYDWLLDKYLIGNIQSQDTSSNIANLLTFLIRDNIDDNKDGVFAASSYSDNYKRFKKDIIDQLNINKSNVIKTVSNFILSKPYQQGYDLKTISDLIVKELNRIPDLDLSKLNISKNTDEFVSLADQAKQGAVSDLIITGVRKEEAVSLINQVYAIGDDRDTLVKKALKARK